MNFNQLNRYKSLLKLYKCESEQENVFFIKLRKQDIRHTITEKTKWNVENDVCIADYSVSTYIS